MKAIATALAILSLALGGLSLFRVAPPRLIGATLGLGLRSPLAVAAGGAGTILSGNYVCRVAVPHHGFERGVMFGLF